MTVCEAAGDGSDQGTSGSDDSEAAGSTRIHLVAGVQEEGEVGPEAAEGGEHEGTDDGGLAEQRFGAEEGPEGDHRVGVAEIRFGWETAPLAPGERYEGCVEQGGGDEDPTPTVDF